MSFVGNCFDILYPENRRNNQELYNNFRSWLSRELNNIIWFYDREARDYEHNFPRYNFFVNWKNWSRRILLIEDEEYEEKFEEMIENCVLIHTNEIRNEVRNEPLPIAQEEGIRDEQVVGFEPFIAERIADVNFAIQLPNGNENLNLENMNENMNENLRNEEED